MSSNKSTAVQETAHQVFIPFIEEGTSMENIVQKFKNLSLGKVTYIDMHDKKRSRSSKAVSRSTRPGNHSYAFLKVVPYSHTTAGINLHKNILNNATTHVMYDSTDMSRRWDVKPYLSPEERVILGYPLAPALTPPLTPEPVVVEEVVDQLINYPYRTAVLAHSVKEEEPEKEVLPEEYLGFMTDDALSSICRELGRPPGFTTPTEAPIIIQYNTLKTLINSTSEATDYDDLQNDIYRLLFAAEQSILPNVPTMRFDHEQSPRLFSVWGSHRFNCV